MDAASTCIGLCEQVVKIGMLVRDVYDNHKNEEENLLHFRGQLEAFQRSAKNNKKFRKQQEFEADTYELRFWLEKATEILQHRIQNFYIDTDLTIEALIEKVKLFQNINGKEIEECLEALHKANKLISQQNMTLMTNIAVTN
eukprot:Awhi_evm3s14438